MAEGGWKAGFITLCCRGCGLRGAGSWPVRGGYMVMMRHMFDTTTTQQMIDHHLRTGCESHLGRVNGCWVEVDFLGNYLMTSKAM